MEVVAGNRRGRRRLDEGPALRRDQLVAVLLDLAGREGAEAINMRKVAAEAGVSPRLLYSMVRDKAEMIDLLCDAIMARAPAVPATESWKARLRTIARNTRRGIASYPGVPVWMLSRSAADPKQPLSKRSVEAVRDALREAGLEGEAVQTAYLAFAAFTLGHLVMSDGADPTDRATAPARLEAAFEAGLDFLLQGFEQAGRA